MKSTSFIVFGALLLGGQAYGEVLYSQPQSGTGTRVSSTLNYFGVPPGYQTYEDFTLAGSASVSVVNWWGDLSTPVATPFDITFYAGGATPGAQLATFNVSPTVATGSAVITYTATLSTPFDAVGGTQYWISIFNGAPDARWAWAQSSVLGNSLIRRLDTNTFQDTFAVAFSLEDAAAVPEPSTIVLLGAGISVLLVRRRARC